MPRKKNDRGRRGLQVRAHIAPERVASLVGERAGAGGEGDAREVGGVERILARDRRRCFGLRTVRGDLPRSPLAVKGGRLRLDQGEGPAIAVLRSRVEGGGLADRKSDQHAHCPRIGSGGRCGGEDLVHSAAIVHQAKAEPRGAFHGERMARGLPRGRFEAQVPQRVAHGKRPQRRERGPAQSPTVAGGGTQKSGDDPILGMDGKGVILRGHARIRRARRRRVRTFGRGGSGVRVGRVVARGISVVGRDVGPCGQSSRAGGRHLKRETPGCEQADSGEYDQRNKPRMLFHDTHSFFACLA